MLQTDRRNRHHIHPVNWSLTAILLAACGGGGGGGGGSASGPAIAGVPNTEFKRQPDGSFLGKVPENQINVDNLLGPEVSRLWSGYDISITSVSVTSDTQAIVQVSGPAGTATMTFTISGTDAHKRDGRSPLQIGSEWIT